MWITGEAVPSQESLISAPTLFAVVSFEPPYHREDPQGSPSEPAGHPSEPMPTVSPFFLGVT